VRRILLTTVLALALGSAAPASAQVSSLYEEYLATGAVSGCTHPPGEIANAMKDIPADIRAYDPGFADALNTALEERASGCAAIQEQANNVLLPATTGTVTAPDGSPGPVAAAAATGLRNAPSVSSGTASGFWVGLVLGLLPFVALVLFFTLRPSARREPA
jgi:hypothetical protein